MSVPPNDSLMISGIFLAGFAQSCVNLNIVAGQRATRLLANYEFGAWYPYGQFRELQVNFFEAYSNGAPILERVGIEMMRAWYHFGPGKDIVKTGVDFLHFQTGSQGYASVVKGPVHEVGSFVLEDVNSERGYARILSTTPFDRDMERGVLIGGMSAPGDLDFVDVTYDRASNCHIVEFH
ncbi:MAG: hypothetical protein IPN01_16810 [Deltaproteobacteria bacterium]|nr:hypothetical protein [Deltaproteobacteria bacterium]